MTNTTNTRTTNTTVLLYTVALKPSPELVPLLVEGRLVEPPLGRFSLQLLVEGVGQRDEGRVQEVHGELRSGIKTRDTGQEGC